MAKQKRTCAYCGQEKCPCEYVAGRAGEISVTGWNTSAQTNLEEMQKELRIFLESQDPKTPTVWKFSFTRLDVSKVGKLAPRKRR